MNALRRLAGTNVAVLVGGRDSRFDRLDELLVVQGLEREGVWCCEEEKSLHIREVKHARMRTWEMVVTPGLQNSMAFFSSSLPPELHWGVSSRQTSRDQHRHQTYTYIHIYMYIYIYTHAYIYIYMYINTHIIYIININTIPGLSPVAPTALSVTSATLNFLLSPTMTTLLLGVEVSRKRRGV